jgi:hypothetical protein
MTVIKPPIIRARRCRDDFRDRLAGCRGHEATPSSASTPHSQGSERKDISMTTQQEITFEECFGGCPECGKSDGYVNVHRIQYGFCEKHECYWMIGANYFSCWRDETWENWQRNAAMLADFREVEEIYPGESKPETPDPFDFGDVLF